MDKQEIEYHEQQSELKSDTVERRYPHKVKEPARNGYSVSINNRIIGMIYGSLYGDTLGASYEFGGKNPVLPIVLKPIRKFYRSQNKWKVGALGQYTDDTEMAIILLKYLIAHRYTYKRDEVCLVYIKWVNSKLPFLCTNTKTLFLVLKLFLGIVRDIKNNSVRQLTEKTHNLMGH